MTRDDEQSPERRRARSERDGSSAKTSDDSASGKERLFSLGSDDNRPDDNRPGDSRPGDSRSGDSTVPLAAVFKTRRPRDGRDNTPPPTPNNAAPPPVPGASAATNTAGPTLDVLDEDAIEIEPDEGFDVLLTHDFRVAAPSNPPTGTPTAKPSQPPARRSVLADAIPPDADPVWAREAVLALIAERAAARARPTGMWYHELFNVDYLKSELPVSPEQIRSEVTFIEAALALPTAGRVLDLGCGYGRHTVPLARRGYDMVGLDLSIDLLQNALRRAQAKAASIKFVHGDIRDLEFDQVFDGVYCFNTTFGYFSDAENLTVLRGVHRALKPGGRFLIEVVNRDNAIQAMPIRNWWEGDGCLIQEDVDFDHLTSRLMVKRFLVYADGTQREYDIALRLFSVHELVAMLRLVGFRYVDLAGSIHTPGAFFGVGSDRILLTVER